MPLRPGENVPARGRKGLWRWLSTLVAVLGVGLFVIVGGRAHVVPSAARVDEARVDEATETDGEFFARELVKREVQRHGRTAAQLRDAVTAEVLGQPITPVTWSNADRRYCRLTGCLMTGAIQFAVGAGGGTPLKLIYDQQELWCSTTACTVYANIYYDSASGHFKFQNSAGTAPGLDVGGCSFGSTSSGALSCNTTGLFAQYARVGQFWQTDGEAQATLQTRVPTGVSFEGDTTNNVVRIFENGNWNRACTFNADGGTPRCAGSVAAKATQAEAAATTVGFALASDRAPFGSLLMFSKGDRLNQIGGATQWATEQRTLAINPHHESTVLSCNECSPTTITAFDGLTITDAAAAGTTVIQGVDFRNSVTAAAAASVSSVISRVPETRRNQFPHMTWNAYVSATTSERVWYGLSSVALNAADAPVGNIAAFRFSTNASDTKWQACTGDGTTTTCSDTGVSVSVNHLYTLEVDCRDSAAGKCLFTVTLDHNAGTATIEKTTNLPLAATNMSIRFYCEALAASARTCGVGPSALETL